MYCVSVNLTTSEWVKIRDAAQKAFPNEVLSRSEIIRRYALTGIEVLAKLGPQDKARAQYSFQQSMGAGEERMKH
jgi:hypothetical protein